jgi:ABC-type glycerol-3-phosphate transport system substrate-binding protein
VDVLKKLVWDPVHVHQIEPPEGLPAAQTMLKEGTLAMAVQSQAVLNQARLERRESAPHLDFLIKPPFKGGDVRIVGEGGWGAALYRASAHKDAAGPFLSYLIGEKPQSLWNIVLECRSSATGAAYKSAACQAPQYAFNHRVWAVQQQGKVRYFGNEAGTPGDAFGVLNRLTDELRAGSLAPKRAAELADEELNRKHEEFRAALAAARP